MAKVLVDLLCILFVCVTVTDKFNFWQNLAQEIRRMVMGTKKEVQLPYLLKCSLCQCFWLSLLYIILTGHFSIPYITLCVAVASLNQIAFQLLNLIENLIIIIFRKMMDYD